MYSPAHPGHACFSVCNRGVCRCSKWGRRQPTLLHEPACALGAMPELYVAIVIFPLPKYILQNGPHA